MTFAKTPEHAKPVHVDGVAPPLMVNILTQVQDKFYNGHSGNMKNALSLARLCARIGVEVK